MIKDILGEDFEVSQRDKKIQIEDDRKTLGTSDAMDLDKGI